MLKPFPLFDRPIVSLDIESTGVDPAKDKIIDLSLIKFMHVAGDVIESDKLNFRFNPGVAIPKAATEVHKITDEMVANCPPFGVEHARQIFQFITGCDLLTYGNMDIAMLHEHITAFHGQFWDVSKWRVFDPSVIFKKKEPRDLTAAMKKYCSAEHVGAHGAEADARAAYRVFMGQLMAYDDIGATPDEVAKFSKMGDNIDLSGKFVKGPDGRPMYNFGAKRGTYVADDPGLARWMLGKDFTRDTLQHAERILEEIWSDSHKQSALGLP